MCVSLLMTLVLGLEHDERMWSLLRRFLVAASACPSLGPRVAINDHGSVGRYNNCSPFTGSMTARQRVRADLVNVVFSRAMLTSEVLDSFNAVNKPTDILALEDAVNVTHCLPDKIRSVDSSGRILLQR
jgi:hypothetical protein